MALIEKVLDEYGLIEKVVFESECIMLNTEQDNDNLSVYCIEEELEFLSIRGLRKGGKRKMKENATYRITAVRV